MPQVTVTIPEIAKMLEDIAQSVVDEAAETLLTFAQDRLTQLAGSKLDPKKAAQYQNALKVTKTKDSVTISLEDPSIINLEAGSAKRDMKPALLSGPKAKQGKNGPYADVPFEHGVSKRGPSRLTGQGPLIDNVSARRVVKALIKVGLATGHQQKAFKGKWSLTSKRRRVADMRITPGGANGNVDLVTFRRVSAKSDPSSWVYPDKAGLNFFDTVSQEIDQMKDSLIGDIVDRHTT